MPESAGRGAEVGGKLTDAHVNSARNVVDGTHGLYLPARNDGVSQVELSRRTRRDPTRLGRHLDDLSARGLVARSRGRDQRQLAVTLTPAGRELLDAVRNEIRGREDEFLAAVLSPLEAVELRRLLAILASAQDASA